MMLGLYRLVTQLGGPLIDVYLGQRLKKGKEHPQRFPERRGEASIPRPKGPLVWIHGASVGESIAILPLIDRLRALYPDYGILVTTGTLTSAALLEKRLPEGVIHQFVPVDRLPFVCRFLDHWQPDLAFWIESEFWPNLLLETSARGVPMILVNGRISERSFASWQKRPRMIKRLLACFRLCMGQSELDRQRLVALGKPDAVCTGNLKYDAPPLPVDNADLAQVRTALDGRPAWLAASTHAGEEEAVARIHTRLRKTWPDLLTVLVPRHAARGEAIAEVLQAEGLSVARRSRQELPSAATDIFLGDTMGEMGLYFRIVEINFIGKSLVNEGGQNPLEPARLDSAILLGPHMWNFVEITDLMTQAGAFRAVADEEELYQAVHDLLSHPEKTRTLQEAARAFSRSQSGVMDATLDVLTPYLAGIADESP